MRIVPPVMMMMVITMASIQFAHSHYHSSQYYRSNDILDLLAWLNKLSSSKDEQTQTEFGSDEELNQMSVKTDYRVGTSGREMRFKLCFDYCKKDCEATLYPDICWDCQSVCDLFENY